MGSLAVSHNLIYHSVITLLLFELIHIISTQTKSSTEEVSFCFHGHSYFYC